jgi:Ca2+-dependent lipid-binding protein
MEGRVKFNQIMEKLGVGDLGIANILAKQDFTEHLRRMLLVESKCIVRVYMLNGINMVSKDSGSDSDPYLIVKLGKKKFNERENYEEDQPDPSFFKYFDFEAQFPGCPPLEVSVYDYDEIFGDDLIGTTEVDLEDRFFQPSW